LIAKADGETGRLPGLTTVLMDFSLPPVEVGPEIHNAVGIPDRVCSNCPRGDNERHDVAQSEQRWPIRFCDARLRDRKYDKLGWACRYIRRAMAFQHEHKHSGS
jgi:hypothetical protein